jgi:hypothetical protein
MYEQKTKHIKLNLMNSIVINVLRFLVNSA